MSYSELDEIPEINDIADETADEIADEEVDNKTTPSSNGKMKRSTRIFMWVLCLGDLVLMILIATVGFTATSEESYCEETVYFIFIVFIIIRLMFQYFIIDRSHQGRLSSAITFCSGAIAPGIVGIIWTLVVMVLGTGPCPKEDYSDRFPWVFTLASIWNLISFCCNYKVRKDLIQANS